MRRCLISLALWSGVAGGALIAGAVWAQAPAGAPDATVTLDGSQLPAPPVSFGGRIENDALQSTP